jgi:Flp pilus assembly protein TadG
MESHSVETNGLTSEVVRRRQLKRHAGRIVRDEHGSAELVVATPLLLLLILAVIQFAIYEHASEVAQATASQALAATRVVGGSAASGQSEAQSILGSVGRGVLMHPEVSVTRDATAAQVTVTGSAEAVIPLIHLPVTATSSGPLERFVTGP